ncbi:CHAD domain-containing protein [Nocardia tenerifensis]|uniref:CHAD domain-containing protein n=1 Tax=Nocardia tenerifensis TaxID=228006 RepID=A0A318JX12_9NOCA|nr:CHAD domain-containing protein [Nocardia tenerifensis]PXX62157.1 CHAD domain-containing protein [Nocardia tenerifensis]
MTATAGAAIVAALADNVDRLLAAEPEVRADEPDSIHQMRVATRRLRSVLRSYRGLFERAPAAALGEELKWLATVLGVARDAEVRAERFEKLLAEHGRAAELSAADLGTEARAEHPRAPEHAAADVDAEARVDKQLAEHNAEARTERRPAAIHSAADLDTEAPAKHIDKQLTEHDRAPEHAATDVDAEPCIDKQLAEHGRAFEHAAAKLDTEAHVDNQLAERGPAAIHSAADLDAVTARLVTAEHERYAAAHADVLVALDSARYRELRDELTEWRTDPPLRAARAEVPAADFFTVVLERDRERVQGLIKREPTVTAADRIELLHDIRKSAKRLRYSCEAAEPVLGPAAADLGSRAKRLQTVLGDHRDAVESQHAIYGVAANAGAAGEDTALYRVLAGAEDTAARQALTRYPESAAALSAD